MSLKINRAKVLTAPAWDKVDHAKQADALKELSAQELYADTDSKHCLYFLDDKNVLTAHKEALASAEANLASIGDESERIKSARRIAKCILQSGGELHLELNDASALNDANNFAKEYQAELGISDEDLTKHMAKFAEQKHPIMDLRKMFLGADNIDGAKTCDFELYKEEEDTAAKEAEAAAKLKSEEEQKAKDAADEAAKSVEDKKKDALGRAKAKFGTLEKFIAEVTGHSYDLASDKMVKMCDTTIMRSAPFMTEKSKSGFETGDDRKDFRPSAAELKKINGIAKTAYEPGQLKVYYTRSADSEVDRHNEHFSAKALADMAKYSIEQPVMKNHNVRDSDGVFGKIFDAKAVEGADGKPYLAQKFFMLDTPENKSIIDGIESSINDKLSVGITLDRREYLCDKCNKSMFGDLQSIDWDWSDWCGHMPGDRLKDGSTVTATINRVADFRELSRVTTPAQPKAAIKSIDQEGDPDFATLHSLSKEDKNKVKAFMESMSTPAKSDFSNLFPRSKDGSTKLPPQSSEGNKVNLEDLVKQQGEQIKSLVESNIKMAESFKSHVDEQTEHLNKRVDLLVAEAELHKKAADETREALKLVIDNTLKFQESCHIAVSKSTIDVARQLATTEGMGGSRTKAEDDLKGQSKEDNYYKSFADAMTKFKK